MPATTRSANKQTKLEDVGAGKKKDIKAPAKFVRSKGTDRTSSKKRKAQQPSAETETKSAKKAKASPKQDATSDGKSGDAIIIINRAPVLELWGSCVTHFLHPSVSWSTCLSAGGAISTITAISKGRSIGTIDKPDPGKQEEKQQKRKAKENLEELEVMSFKLRLDKDGQAMVGDKPKKAGEEALRKKFGGSEQYEKVKGTFENALKAWKGREEELDGRAFGMYEDFRPSIPPGQSGWGRKGQLNLEAVKTAISGD